MDRIFMICFLITMAGSLLIDRRMLRQEKGSIKVTYGFFTFLTLGLFFSKYLHWKVPMPSRFFIHTVSPWFARLLGI
ncbi:hypothetical protein HZF08_33255 [Paenibacillus sp. CGMCC 1.16610]|uniref:Uncharacterized protein n=1 Tax=Paenibacillus anseongense TaxID=2682845 RepID=A0ABW9U348_9BACL|nr:MULTISPECIES: hypothetical protein [Paenibacillus]MBA2943139.1 hypothetical protein [Paenibacillus sp. CGMCC 1.16610]MVQ33635.1 hypothetical protein [Paenibacillus anseongense]